MNVGKVSFGNAQPAAGTAQGAQQQQAPVKKADKGDVVVIGGKEIKKSTIAKGGVIATAVAALGTLALAASRGKGLNEAKAAIEKANSGAEGEATKFIQNVKDGFKTFFGEGKKTYKATLEQAEGLKNKLTGGGETVTPAPNNGTNTTPAATEGATGTQGTVQQPTQPQTPAPAPANTGNVADAAAEKVSVQDIVKAQKQVEAAEAQVKALKTNMPADVTKPTAPTAPIKPVEPEKVKEPKNVVTEPVRKSRKGKPVKLSDIEKNNPEQLSDAEKKQLKAFKNYTERKAAWAQYQTDLAQYQTDMTKYTTDLATYKTDLSAYNKKLGEFEKYQNAQKTLEAAEARVQEAKGNLSTMQKGASKEVRKAAAGLNGKTLQTLEENVNKAMAALENATDKNKAKLQANFEKAQDALTAYLQIIG